MDDHVERRLSERVIEGFDVGNVLFHQRRPARSEDPGDVASLDPRRIERIEIVDDEDGIPARDEALANVAANETRAAGNENVHRSDCPREVAPRESFPDEIAW